MVSNFFPLAGAKVREKLFWASQPTAEMNSLRRYRPPQTLGHLPPPP